MGLPAAIQAQIDAADAFVENINGEAPPQEVQNQPLQPEPQITQVAPQPEPINQVSEGTWERKFITLQGKYDAEVPRMNAQVRELNDTVRQLVAENATLKATPSPSAPVTQALAITDTDREAFGADLIDLADRIAKQNVAQYQDMLKQQAEQIKKLEGQVGNVSNRQGMSDQERVFGDLTKAVPDWEAVNADQKFLNWLADIDPIYGTPRQTGLDSALNAFDAPRLAAIFNAYKGVAPKAPTNARADLERQVTPGKSRSGQVPVDNAADTRIYSQKEVADFYNEWNKGRVDTGEATKFEAIINAAAAEGRIR